MNRIDQDYWDECFRKGIEFEDYVAKTLPLTTRGALTFTPYRTKEEQYEKGESVEGVEVKRDGKFRETGNLYIETYEKQPDHSLWVPSGINRGDSEWFVIGDELQYWVFKIATLQKVKKWCLNTERVGEYGPTSRGILLRVWWIEWNKLAEWTFIGDEGF